MTEAKNCFYIPNEWIEQLKILDDDIFAHFILSLVEYHKTRDKSIIGQFCGVEKAYFINLISQMEREGL